MTLRFDPESHRYFWDDVHVPNVTSILSPLVDYARVPWAVLEKARQEGVAMHKMVELYVADDLDEQALPEWLRPRLEAFQKFQAESGFKVEGSERRVYHVAHRYAGTLDLVGDMNGDLTVIDIKRSLFAGPAIGLQLAAYQEAENDRRKREKLPKATKRYALQLRAKGDYKLEPYEDKNDFAVFLALLTLKRWRETHEPANT